MSNTAHPILDPETRLGTPPLLRCRGIWRCARYLLFGAVLTLLVSWSISIANGTLLGANHADQELYWGYLDQTQVLLIGKRTAAGIIEYFPSIYPTSSRSMSQLESDFGVPVSEALIDVMDLWALNYTTRDVVVGRFVGAESEEVLVASGWPFRSLWCSYAIQTDSQRREWHAKTGIAIGGIPGGRWSNPPGNIVEYGFPLWPLAIGFALDTVIYAITSWLLLAVICSVLRQRRRRLGRCARCGYDLRATTTGVCPECGAAITPRAAT